ncbi:hypothetical protein B1B_15035, partial [mine drainage metagenome]
MRRVTVTGERPQSPPESEETSRSWTVLVRRLLQRELPIEHLLPDREPAYVGSWVYIFGVVAIASLVLVIA